MFNILSGFPYCDTLSDLFLFSDPSICSIMTFFPIGNSDHAVASVLIDFRSTEDVLFHCRAFNYYHGDWNDLNEMI